MNDMTVSKALKWIFIAAILNIFSGLGVIGAIIGIIALILDLLALYGASKLDRGYHTAFVLSVAGIIVTAIGMFAGDNVFGVLVDIVSSVVNLGILYFVVITTCTLLESGGNSDIAKKGYTVWKINLICTIASVVLGLLGLISLALAAILAIVVLIVSLIGSILYLVFLYKSYNAL